MLLLLLTLVPGLFLFCLGLGFIILGERGTETIIAVVGGPVLSAFCYSVHSIPFDIADANLNTSRSSTMQANKVRSEELGDQESSGPSSPPNP